MKITSTPKNGIVGMEDRWPCKTSWMWEIAMGMRKLWGNGKPSWTWKSWRDGKLTWEWEIMVGMGNPRGNGKSRLGLGNHRGNGKSKLGLGNRRENGKSRWEIIAGIPTTAPAPVWAAGAPLLCTDTSTFKRAMPKIPGFPRPANFVPGWDKPSQGRIFPSSTPHSQAGGGDQPGKKLPAPPAGRKAPFPEGGEPQGLASTPGRRGRGQPAVGKGRSDPPGRAGSRLSGCPAAVWAQRGCSPRTKRSG